MESRPPKYRHPRGSGGPSSLPWNLDSRLRGNDGLSRMAHTSIGPSTLFHRRRLAHDAFPPATLSYICVGEDDPFAAVRHPVRGPGLVHHPGRDRGVTVESD